MSFSRFQHRSKFPRCPRLALGAALHSGMLLRVKKKGLSVEACPSPVGFSLSWLFLFALCFLLALSFVTCDMLDSVCMSAPVCFLENDCVFLHICDGLSHSLLCLFLISLSSPVSSSLFVQSFAAMLFTVILH